MEDVITINGKKIYPGESAEVSMSNMSFPTRTEIEVPVFVCFFRQECMAKR
jgi:hypothetical protein